MSGDIEKVSGAELSPQVVDGTVEIPADDRVSLPPGDDALRAAGAVTRRDARVSRPKRHPQWLVNQLPVGMLGSDFFVRFVSIFQEMSETLMDGADQVEHIADSTVAPTPLLPYLASWIDVQTVDPSLAEDVQRVILRSSARALALRGTRRGLEEYLRMLCTGGEVPSDPASVRVEDGGGVWAEGEAPDDVAWVTMHVPGTGHLSEDEFVALIRDEVPAHVRAELYIDGRRVLNTVEEHDGSPRR